MNALYGRIFQHPPEDLDETSRGFLIGGMAVIDDDIAMARSYGQAAGQLLKAAAASNEPWCLEYPFFLMYRHALELYLKAIVKPVRPRHELGPLLNAVDTLLVQRTHRGIPARLKADLLIMADLDPKSDAFRYSRKANGDRQNIPGEYWVPFDDLSQGMEDTLGFLEKTWRELGN